MSGDLTLDEVYSEDFTKVSVRGEIDIYNACNFKEKLYDIVDKSKKDIIVDLGNLSYIDSTGLGIFVGALKKAKLSGKNIRVENTKDNIKKLFTITGLDKLFMI
ncbi:MAG: STAS domain-containing protein [Acetivibrionales bacterium]|jgi:anti-sigma B factor antagonist